MGIEKFGSQKFGITFGVLTMPRLARELTDAEVRRLKWARIQSGSNKGAECNKLHAVGGVGGLYLHCAPPASGNTTFARSWILKTPIGKDTPELGLGPYPEVTLSVARQKAREFKEQIRQGIDPRVTRKALASALVAEQAKAVTFCTVAGRFIVKKGKEFKTAKQVQKLLHTSKPMPIQYCVTCWSPISSGRTS